MRKSWPTKRKRRGNQKERKGDEEKQLLDAAGETTLIQDRSGAAVQEPIAGHRNPLGCRGNRIELTGKRIKDYIPNKKRKAYALQNKIRARK